jgi:hypothetical protein
VAFPFFDAPLNSPRPFPPFFSFFFVKEAIFQAEMDNKVFFIRYLENEAVSIETHFKGDGDPRPRPITYISQLIQGTLLYFHPSPFHSTFY